MNHLEISNKFIKPREITEILEVINNSGVVILPTDCGYSLVCKLGDKKAASRISQLRNLGKNHFFTLLCADLPQLSNYGKVDNVQFRLLKQILPAAITCILLAQKDTPKIMQHEKRKTIGIRVPDFKPLQDLIKAQNEPLMSVSLFSGEEENSYLSELKDEIRNAVDLIVDCGDLLSQNTTVIDFLEMPPTVLRQGVYEVNF